MKKIESLTPEQEKRLVEYRNKWLAIGRSTEPANRPAAEKAITRMYELLGHPKPRFWWSDGPAVGSLVRVIVTDKEFKKGDYELLSVDFPGLVQDARYLKMLNPSIGVWHMEGVDRACKTVQEAINWRAGELLPAGEAWQPA